MAKKKAGKDMQATEEELKVVRLALPREAHKEFRQWAAAEESNMAILARRIILEAIERRRKESKR